MVVLGEWANLRIAGTLVTIAYFFLDARDSNFWKS